VKVNTFCEGLPSVVPYQDRLKKEGTGSKCPSAFHHVNFYEAGTGSAGIILILPAGIACPAPAEDALAEL
jgi:hypothetical protein